MREPYIGTALSRIRAATADRQVMVPADPVRQRLQLLLDLGMSVSGIARAAGVSTALVTVIADGTQKTMRPVTARALMSVDGRAHKQQALVLNVGCRRRIEGLGVLGFSFPVIGAEVGADSRLVWQWQKRRWVTWATHERVRTAFDRMGPDGGNTKIRNIAARRGWVHPLLWTDIDDPFETTPTEDPSDAVMPDPVAVERLIAGLPVSAAAVDKREAFSVLLSRGMTMSGAATQVGINHQTAVRYSESEVAA